MKTFFLLSIVSLMLLLTVPAMAQTSCFQYGEFISCDSSRGHTDQLQLSPSQGVITDDKGNVEPYALFPAPSRPSQPLNDVLPRSDRSERRSRESLFVDDGSSVMDSSGPVFVPYGEASQ